jgi:methionine-rich copper-binding protein CopC
VTGRGLEDLNPMRSTRLAIGASIALSFAIMPVVVLAHAELSSSSPAADDTLNVPPAAVSLVFDGELTPDGTGFTVTDPDGDVVGEGALDLTVAERNEVRGDLDAGGPGTYTVTWTATAADGHQERGDFSFSVAASDAEQPNTATMPPAGDRLLRWLGSIVLIVAASMAVRRVLRRAA